MAGLGVTQGIERGEAVSRPLRIGLTGGIGSGKSTVAALLAGHGAAVIDTDAISRRLTLSGGAAIVAIRSAFGPALIDASGALDRARMRELVFDAASGPAARHRLEAILHPLIGEETRRLAAASAAPVIVFDVPLLVESGRWRSQVDRVLVVDCADATQIERVMRRSGWDEATVRGVIAQQATRPQRRAVADAVLFNDGIDESELATQVAAIWSLWTASASAMRPWNRAATAAPSPGG